MLTGRANCDVMTQRILGLRDQFVAEMAKHDLDFSFIAQQQGMFSFLGISPEQVLENARKARHLHG